MDNVWSDSREDCNIPIRLRHMQLKTQTNNKKEQSPVWEADSRSTNK
jgi:hypothetical protein